MHFRFHAYYFLLPWKISTQSGRRTINALPLLIKGSNYHTKHISIQNLPQLSRNLEISTMFYICTYCFFTWYGSYCILPVCWVQSSYVAWLFHIMIIHTRLIIFFMQLQSMNNCFDWHFVKRNFGEFKMIFVTQFFIISTGCMDVSAPPSKNAVSANIKHSRFFH